MNVISKLVTIFLVTGLFYCTTTTNTHQKESMSAPEDVLSIVNQERVKRRLKTLTPLPSLTCAAQNHATDIGTRKKCTHTGKDGSNFVTRVKRCGYHLMSGGEIVACGHTSARLAVNGWLKSSGHYAVMMDPKQKYFGSGMKNNYWTVVFSKK